MAQWIRILSFEVLTTPSAHVGLELDDLIALIGRNQITIMFGMSGLSSGRFLTPLAFPGFGLGMRML